MTLRNQDNLAEAAVADFLDQYFYPVYTSGHKRVESREAQFKGIDAIVLFKGEQLLVDEKTAAHYVNQNLPTFAFELDFIGRDYALHEGWFYDEKKETQYYLLSWIWATTAQNFSTKDITRLDILLVERQRIQEMLRAHGLDKEAALDVSKHLRKHGKYGVYGKSDKPFYFYFTEHLFEKPINLILKKAFLQEISMMHLTLKP